jgi:hypothetical protein
VRRILARESAKADWTWSPRRALPAELRASAASRVGKLGLITVATLLAFCLLSVQNHFGDMDQRGIGPAVPVVIAAGIALTLSILIFAFSWYRRDAPHQIIALALPYQLLMAAAIGVCEYGMQGPSGAVEVRWSGVAVWIIIFAVFVPSTPTRTLYTSTAAALMDPLVFGVAAALRGDPVPDLLTSLKLFGPTVLAVATAVVAASITYRLGRQIQDARQMGSYRLVEQLGTPPDVLFASFDREPLAAASIGQVHRGTLPDGREAVVKVQFPGIADAMRADIGNGAVLFAFGQLLFPHVKRSDLRDELLQVMLEECDYRLEAANQREFGELWKGHDIIVVPRVFEEFCTERVITTEFIAGQRFDEFVAGASQSSKDRAGYAMLENMLVSFFGHGLFNGDPHPGNYIFGDDGTVAFLDYGCVKHIPDAKHGHFRDFLAATIQGDAQALTHAVRALGYAPPGVEFSADEWLRVEQYVQRPWLRDRVFTFEPEYVRGVWPLLLKNPEMRKIGLPREFLFFNRLWFGLYAILTELRASGNFHEIVRELLVTGHHPDQ